MTASPAPWLPDGRKSYDLAAAEHDFPRWDGPPRRTILICTHPRSGSTLLGEALYFSGGLGCPLEYFHRGFRPPLAVRWNAPGIESYTRATHRFRTDAGGVLAVKLFWEDVENLARELDPACHAQLSESPPAATSPQTYRDLAALLRHIFPNPVWVYLERRDRVRQAVSSLAAAQTGLWRSIPNVGECVAARQPGFDYQRIASLVACSDCCRGHWRNFFEAVPHAPYMLAYEDMSTDYASAVAGVLNYLGSIAPVPPIRMRRQSDARTESLVLRFLREHEVQTSGVGTP